MAHILIATASPTQRRIFATVLKAARHHVVTTNDAALTLAVIHESTQPLILLLGELLDPLQRQSRLSASDVLIHALESPRRTAFDPQHAYILLTQQPQDALPARVRTHLASGRVALLSPNCTIGELLGAVEDATERLEAPFSSAFACTAVTAMATAFL
jgi:CheY-like chemotaxis protein